MELQRNKLILFDGICNLCNGAVQFVIRHDHKSQFTFGTLQSQVGQQFLDKANLPKKHLNTFLYVKNGEIFSRSTAALLVLKDLGGFLSIFYAFIIIPAFLRDRVYGLVARSRYFIFGKAASCKIPTPELKSRFIS